MGQPAHYPQDETFSLLPRFDKYHRTHTQADGEDTQTQMGTHMGNSYMYTHTHASYGSG